MLASVLVRICTLVHERKKPISRSTDLIYFPPSKNCPYTTITSATLCPLLHCRIQIIHFSHFKVTWGNKICLYRWCVNQQFPQNLLQENNKKKSLWHPSPTPSTQNQYGGLVPLNPPSSLRDCFLLVALDKTDGKQTVFWPACTANNPEIRSEKLGMQRQNQGQKEREKEFRQDA